MAEMSNDEFELLCNDAKNGNVINVLPAVDINRGLATRVDDCLNTLLIWACRGRHINFQMVEGLLKRGSYVNVQSCSGWNALMRASKNGNIAVCTLLLDYGANPDSNNEAYSALSVAAQFGHIQVCLLLISRRANLMLPLTYGTALNICKREEHRSILLTAFQRLQVGLVSNAEPLDLPKVV
jgi:ankyrin repeat protein